MKNIEVKILNPDAVLEAEHMMVAMARLTQHSHTIENMKDFEDLLDKEYKDTTVESMSKLPHPTLQKFGVINIAIVGASRRFLGQITRHQNEVKFMSGSLQYSDYSADAQFCVPYEITEADKTYPGLNATGDFYERYYLNGCQRDLDEYRMLAKVVGNDAAGYKMPQGMRNVLLISALPYELKHMISQRVCNRNTLETQYVLLKIWEALWPLSPMFRTSIGPSCMQTTRCAEGKMSCGSSLYSVPVDAYMQKYECSLPTAILDTNFKYIREVL